MDGRDKYSVQASKGWTFYSLEYLADGDGNGEGDGDTPDNGLCASLAKQSNIITSSHDDDQNTLLPLSNLVNDFNNDGFLALSSLLTPTFIRGLHTECMDIFNGVLDFLLDRGEVEFKSSYRKHHNRTTTGSYTEAISSTTRYEYPLDVGLKNGYRELVMRSPGRYEMALLLDELPSHCKGKGVEAIRHSADYEGKWLMTTKMLGNEEPAKTSNIQCNETEEYSCLKQLLGWIQYPCKFKDTDDEQQIDTASMKRFMELVGAIYPPYSINDQSTQQQNQNEYYLCNLSLLVATPGCPTQSWHADGGHVSLSQHEKCHVFNVFIPLVDVPLTMGPTELRPGTHYHTRNLAPMMLAAKARKTLRAPITPELKKGDALVFDYRILHRGGANTSDDCCGTKDEEEESDNDDLGRHRPVLVLTFARRWFKDVCNFPKRTIFGDGR